MADPIVSAESTLKCTVKIQFIENQDPEAESGNLILKLTLPGVDPVQFPITQVERAAVNSMGNNLAGLVNANKAIAEQP